ncbi:hypothetical protein [Streptomyces sp. NPDC020298]|uniref:hypothetical protein n=1 Tax=unclassified Streptomyces TaxID=2593676 RepID=UPI0033DF98E5
MITGTSGPASTHVPVGPDCGVTTYDESYVNCTDLHTVDKPRLRRRLGLSLRLDRSPPVPWRSSLSVRLDRIARTWP